MAVTGAGSIPYMWEFARHCLFIAPPRFPACAKRAQVINALLIADPEVQRPFHIWGSRANHTQIWDVLHGPASARFGASQNCGQPRQLSTRGVNTCVQAVLRHVGISWEIPGG